MAKKSKTNGQKKNSSKSVFTKKVSGNKSQKGKGKGTGRGSSKNAGGTRFKKLPEKKIKYTGKRIHDFRGRFIERKYEERLKKLRAELIRDGAILNGKKVTSSTSYAEITKVIYENKLFERIESTTVSYFDVLSRIISELEKVGEGSELIVKIRPFFKDWSAFNIKYRKIKLEEKQRRYFTQGLAMNPALTMLIEAQGKIIQDFIDTRPKKIISPLFQVWEVRYAKYLPSDQEDAANKDAGLYALSYDYMSIIPSGVNRLDFFRGILNLMPDKEEIISDIKSKVSKIKNIQKYLDTFDEIE